MDILAVRWWDMFPTHVKEARREGCWRAWDFRFFERGFERVFISSPPSFARGIAADIRVGWKGVLREDRGGRGG